MNNLAKIRSQILGDASHASICVWYDLLDEADGGLAGAIERHFPKQTTFERSAFLGARYRFASRQELRAAFTAFAEVTGLSRPEDFETLAMQKVHKFKVDEFYAELDRIRPIQGEDCLGKAFKMFYRAHVLFGLIEDPFQEPADAPRVLNEVFTAAADNLFTLGADQFRTLTELATDVVKWISDSGFQKVVFIESPLGNSVPCQVFQDLAVKTGLRTTVVEWGCPRNNRAGDGTTVRESAVKLAKNVEVSAADFVLFIDDVLTGSRMLKMAKALRNAVGPNRFGAIAMAFKFPKASGGRQFDRRDLARLDKWAATTGLPTGVIEFPELPIYSIDDHGPVYYEGAMAWGDVDIVAGKRKANLVFNLLDHYYAIAKQFEELNGQLIALVEDILWRRDAQGREYYFPEGLTEGMIRRVMSSVDLDALFKQIQDNAKAKFPEDYFGSRASIAEAEVKMRTEWLKSCIREEAMKTIGELDAGFLSRLVTECREAGFVPEVHKPTRDHSYGHYTIPWGAHIQVLNRRLRERIASLAC